MGVFGGGISLGKCMEVGFRIYSKGGCSLILEVLFI